MEKITVKNKKFELEFGVIFADPSSAPKYLLNKKGGLKYEYENCVVFPDVSPEHKAHIVGSLQDFNKRLEEVEILPLPDFLDTTRKLWDCSYTYWETRRRWTESFSLPVKVGAELIEKIREKIYQPVVLKDDKGYWEVPTPWSYDGVFKEKFSPTVILPKGYRLGKNHRIVYRNVGKGALTEYWGDYRL